MRGGDIAQEGGKYNLFPVFKGGKTHIMGRKDDNRGDTKGIWEINGKPAAPGIAFTWEDDRTSYSLNPSLLDDPQWTAGGHSVGKMPYMQGSY